MWYWIIGWIYALVFMIASRHGLKEMLDERALQVEKKFNDKTTVEMLVSLGIMVGIWLLILTWPIHMIYMMFIEVEE